MPIKKFTFFWITGDRDVYEGETAFDAFKKAGYASAALGAVDVWDEGDSNRYEWNKSSRKWELKVEVPAE